MNPGSRAMWRNYWTGAGRALAKSKTYSIINIAGLAIGMAACVMILLYIRYEESYDRWIPDAENSYQFQAWYPSPDDGEPGFFQMSAYVTKDRIKKDYPQVQHAAYFQNVGPVFFKDGEATKTDDYFFTDDDFLKVVNLPLVAGTTLTGLQTAVITQTEARTRFGTDQVLGRVFTLISRGKKMDFKIVGILKDLPKNSHLKVAAIGRVDSQSYNAQNPQF